MTKLENINLGICKLDCCDKLATTILTVILPDGDECIRYYCENHQHYCDNCSDVATKGFLPSNSNKWYCQKCLLKISIPVYL